MQWFMLEPANPNGQFNRSLSEEAPTSPATSPREPAIRRHVFISFKFHQTEGRPYWYSGII